MHAALIDLGTNSVRLHIFKVTKTKEDSFPLFEKVFQRKEMIQLGVGLFATQDFTTEAKNRALTTFQSFSEDLQKYQVQKLYAVGTCAMREAKSGKELRDEIEHQTGISIEIISGETEAQLIANGILDAMGPMTEQTVLVDIGGGSTEISIIQSNQIIVSVSTPIGAVRCQEMTLRDIPPSLDSEQTLRRNIREVITARISKEEADGCVSLIGSSGSVRAILRCVVQSQDSSFKATNNKMLKSCSAKALHEFAISLRELSLEDLLQHPEIEEKRSRIIFAATVILDEIALYFGVASITATQLGLKDGLKYEMSTSL